MKNKTFFIILGIIFILCIVGVLLSDIGNLKPIYPLPNQTNFNNSNVTNITENITNILNNSEVVDG